MAKPQNDDALIDGWPTERRWRDLVFEADCSAKPAATAVVYDQGCETYYNTALAKNVTDCSKQPVYQAALTEAQSRCGLYKAWLTSDEGATEYLGSQYGITEDVADQFFAPDAQEQYGGNIGKSLTAKEWKALTQLWNAKTQAAFQTVLEITPNMLPFIPIWNQLDPFARDVFCIYRPWVPITVWAQEQAKIAAAAQKTKLIQKIKGSPIAAPIGKPKGALMLKKAKPLPATMIVPWCVDLSDAQATVEQQVSQTQKTTLAGTKVELEQRQDAERTMMEEAHVNKVAQFAASCQPGEVIYHKGIKYECYEAQEQLMPDSQQVEEEEEPVAEQPNKALPWILGGVGAVAAGPVGAVAGYAAGAAIARQGAAYVGNGFAGIDPSAGGTTYAQKQQAAKIAKCNELLAYLDANGLDAIAAALQAQPHNNARFLEQKQQLAPDIRELVHECAYFASELMLEEAWAELSPDEQKKHTQWFQEKAKEATKGKPGVTAFCPPGMAPADCKTKIEQEIDKATCKGVNVPLGTIGGRTASFCVSTRVIVGTALGIGALLWIARK